MESTTEAAPAARPQIVAAPERDAFAGRDVSKPENAIADLRLAAWSGDISALGNQNRLPSAAGAGPETGGASALDFSTGNIFASVFDKGDRVQQASLRTGDSAPAGEKVKPGKETFERLNGALDGLKSGDTSPLQQYLRDMNNSSDPRKQQELKAGMKELTNYLNASGLDAQMVMGSLSIKLGAHGKTLTIDSQGQTNLRGNELRDFSKKLNESLEGKSMPNATISERMTDRLDRIEALLDRNNLTGLQAAIKEIGDKIHSVKPSAAGAAERKEAGQLQDMLGVLGDELTGNNVEAWYDRNSGSFSIRQPNARGREETLTIDKFGRSNMSGEQLRDFLTRLKRNQVKQPIVPV